METIIRNICDLGEADRSALERVIGHELRETQRVILNIVDVETRKSVPGSHDGMEPGGVPDWWKIYDGLSDQEIDELDQAIRQRADLTRHFE